MFLLNFYPKIPRISPGRLTMSFSAVPLGDLPDGLLRFHLPLEVAVECIPEFPLGVLPTEVFPKVSQHFLLVLPLFFFQGSCWSSCRSSSTDYFKSSSGRSSQKFPGVHQATPSYVLVKIVSEISS